MAASMLRGLACGRNLACAVWRLSRAQQVVDLGVQQGMRGGRACCSAWSRWRKRTRPTRSSLTSASS